MRSSRGAPYVVESAARASVEKRPLENSGILALILIVVQSLIRLGWHAVLRIRCSYRAKRNRNLGQYVMEEVGSKSHFLVAQISRPVYSRTFSTNITNTNEIQIQPTEWIRNLVKILFLFWVCQWNQNHAAIPNRIEARPKSLRVTFVC